MGEAGDATGEYDRYYKRIFDDFPAMIWRSGLDMKCDYFNHTWLDFTGRSLEQELGDGWAEGVHPEDLAACFATYVDSFKARRPFDMQYRLRDRGGEYRWIRDIGRPFYDPEERFLGYIGSCYDCTEERDRQRRLDEINQAKDRFFSIVAHDLIGPVAAIESLSAMLEQDFGERLDAELAELTGELKQASGRVGTLLGEILDWARSQLQGTVVQTADLVLADLVRDAVAPLLETSRLKRIDISVEVDPSIVVRADLEMVKTVVRNLVSNALKFSLPQGRVELSASAEGDRARLRVADSGVGMDEEHLASLFSLERKHSMTGTGGERGFGLGLLVCKEFVERNGGSIEVRSARGEGSVFEVALPMA